MLNKINLRLQTSAELFVWIYEHDRRCRTVYGMITEPECVSKNVGDTSQWKMATAIKLFCVRNKVNCENTVMVKVSYNDKLKYVHQVMTGALTQVHETSLSA